MNPNSVSNPEPWEPNQGLHLPLPPVKSRRNERRNEEYQQACQAGDRRRVSKGWRSKYRIAHVGAKQLAKAEAAMISQGLAPS
jgi:hypothetical protein